MEKITEPRGAQVYGVQARRGSGVYRYNGAEESQICRIESYTA